ncbi:MAG: thioredoxin TrxA [Gemmatimonadota bacterium]|nr:thioredoxin TrxA [Gemmatimonadota bacterium]
MASNSIHTVTDQSFDEDVRQADTLTLVDFWADWCGPCKMIAPTIEELADEYEGRLKVCKLDVDENQRTAQEYAVRSIPSLLFFKDGEVVETVVGAVRKQRLEEVIEANL